MTSKTAAKKSSAPPRAAWKQKYKEAARSDEAEHLRGIYSHVAAEVAKIPAELKSQYTVFASARQIHALGLLRDAGVERSVQALIRTAIDEFLSRRLTAMPSPSSVARTARRRAKREESARAGTP